MDDDFRDSLLPKGADNPVVWCEREQRYHRYYTFTQDDYDATIKAAAKNLSAAIDAKALEHVYRELNNGITP